MLPPDEAYRIPQRTVFVLLNVEDFRENVFNEHGWISTRGSVSGNEYLGFIAVLFAGINRDRERMCNGSDSNGKQAAL
jgi:hypothetical protein